ncbi:MAG: etfB1 [Candidatus Nitrosotenuis sp.]|nr:etfB1 [Candidatus Nitrosotenuis sp.]
MKNDSATKNELVSAIENEAKFRIDGFIQGAIDLAEEVHADVKREDGIASFLETHVWPVTIDVIRHYKLANKPLTTLQIVSSMLHDVMEDNEKILDLYTAKAYGFDAYFRHRFGDYVYNIAMILKVKPLESYQGSNDNERQTERFREYCSVLASSEYDVKTIKLADRLNNMRFIARVHGHEKIGRYIREAEDFYLAYSIIPPCMGDFYTEIRKAYEDLRNVKVNTEFVIKNKSK